LKIIWKWNNTKTITKKQKTIKLNLKNYNERLTYVNVVHPFQGFNSKRKLIFYTLQVICENSRIYSQNLWASHCQIKKKKQCAL